MSKRTKKYNPNKSADAYARLLIKDLVLVCLQRPEEAKAVSGYSLRTGGRRTITKAIQERIQNGDFLFTICNVVWSEEANGKLRTVSELVQSPYPCNHMEILDNLETRHQLMVSNEKAKGNVVYNAGWAAVTNQPANLSQEKSDWCEQRLVALLNKVKE